MLLALIFAAGCGGGDTLPRERAECPTGRNPMIEEPPLLQIRRQFRRPASEVQLRFRDTPTGFLADCMDGRGALDWRIKPVDPERATFAGPALPCLWAPAIISPFWPL